MAKSKISQKRFDNIMAMASGHDRIKAIRRLMKEGDEYMRQLIMPYAVDLALDGDNKMLTELIKTYFPITKVNKVEGTVSHEHAAVMKQIEEMSRNDKEKFVQDHLIKKSRGELPVAPDYEVIE